MAPLEVDCSNSFFLLTVNWSRLPVICLVQKNRHVQSSLRPGKKDKDLSGFEPPTSQSNA